MQIRTSTKIRVAKFRPNLTPSELAIIDLSGLSGNRAKMMVKSDYIMIAAAGSDYVYITKANIDLTRSIDSCSD